MSDGARIPVNIEVNPREEQPAFTGRLSAMLSEILQALEALHENGEQHEIDLLTLPLSEPEKEKLTEILGQGEVDITINTLGLSTIRETAVSGVWWLNHFNNEKTLLAEHIVIACEPPLVSVGRDEVGADISVFQQQLSKLQMSEHVQ